MKKEICGSSDKRNIALDAFKSKILVVVGEKATENEFVVAAFQNRQM
jgi:hypothetical protein